MLYSYAVARKCEIQASDEPSGIEDVQIQFRLGQARSHEEESKAGLLRRFCAYTGGVERARKHPIRQVTGFIDLLTQILDAQQTSSRQNQAVCRDDDVVDGPIHGRLAPHPGGMLDGHFIDRPATWGTLLQAVPNDPVSSRLPGRPPC